MTTHNHHARSTMMVHARVLTMAAVVAVAACDTTVTNPGPVQDQFLEDRNAGTAMVNGAGRALASGLNWVSYTGAAVAREIHPAGSTGSFGITNLWQNGALSGDDADLDSHWEQTQRARWLAEEAIRRLTAAGAPTPGTPGQTPTQYNTLLQTAYVYAGYANRVLGENMCQAVFDGGAAQPAVEYLKRAEDHFNKAIALGAGNLQNAAYAGRAQVRLFQANYAGAAADAALVPNTFTYTVAYYNLGDDAQRNRIQWAIANTPYRAHTQWGTWHKDYYDQTRDSRVPYTTTALQGDAAIDCCGRVPFLPQAKYATTGGASPMKLANGREMRLIEAEVKLRAGDVAGAVAGINAVRALVTQAPVTATTATDAWTMLKRERGIELWLEARRLGDLRRWKDGNTPGALNVLEQVGSAAHLTRQDLCFPISRSESQTNPNLRS